MKRFELFEFEDFKWFPSWLRRCMTRAIMVLHKMLKTEEELAEVLSKLQKETDSKQIIDLCSGSGGPMISVVNKLRKQNGNDELKLILTDLYPDLATAKRVNSIDDGITYETSPIDATNVSEDLEGLRTMICSFHHMNPNNAKQILRSAQEDRQPICILEISDNSYPKFIWWISIPTTFIMSFFITPFVRPFSWQQFVFTYIIPIIPIFFAWDGAVSNARTYTLNDLDQLLEGIQSDDYIWEKGVIRGKSKKIFLTGKPKL